MLYYVTREQHAYTIDRLLTSLQTSWLPPPEFIRTATYETLFALRRAPIANYVFTDLDRLTGFEIDAATEIAKSLVAADPTVRITNWPNKPAGRYTLLRRLYEAGLNSFNVWRLDEERAPDAFPVFIRREQDALGPESPLLHTEAEFRAEVARLRAAGKALTGRIAVQYLSARDEQGRHRKYGAFRFGDRIVPQHLMVSDSWIVKRALTDLAAQIIEEERDYVVNNPHAEQLLKVFDLAEIDFGRIDYCISNGRIEVFEINTNPHFPRARISDDDRMFRRKIVVEGIIDGFRGLDPPNARHGLARFRTPQPKLHRLRSRSLGRRLMDWMTFWRWRTQHGPSLARAKRRKPVA
ncbi:MAG: hypothetical protein C0484_08970 [Rhodospirillum sp.]|jgi:hypothetical protein|nr:hypothetical protein [Rhodospirillum sp.]